MKEIKIKDIKPFNNNRYNYYKKPSINISKSRITFNGSFSKEVITNEERVIILCSKEQPFIGFKFTNEWSAHSYKLIRCGDGFYIGIKPSKILGFDPFDKHGQKKPFHLKPKKEGDMWYIIFEEEE
jgi:hypothetical protein